MSGIDLAFIAIILFGAYRGYREGFLLALFSLLGLVLGILGGFKLMGLAMLFLADKFNVDEKVLPYLAFAFVFVIIVILVSLVGRLLKTSIDKSFLGRVDEASGACLGVLKTAFLLSVALWIFDSLDFAFPNTWKNESWIMPLIANFAPQCTSLIGKVVPAFKDIL